MPSFLTKDGSTSDVAANYNRLTGINYTVSGGVRTYLGPYTNFGTRPLKFLVCNFGTGGTYDIDLTRQTVSDASNYTGTYADVDAYLANVVRIAQQYVEIFAVGKPTATDVVLVVAGDTANSSESSNGTAPIATTYGLLEAALKAGVGTGKNHGVATGAYDGTVTVSNYALVGATIAAASELPFLPA